MLAKIRSSTQKCSQRKEVFETSTISDVDVSKTPDEAILLPYQIHWITREKPICVDEKSRQIGWSYTHACRATYKALAGDRSTIYTCYNKESTKQFIKDCVFWAKKSNQFIKNVTGVSILKDSEINVFEIKFLNGHSIASVAGNPENLRGKPGYDIIIDEAAYRSKFPLEDILAAGLATRIRGGTIRIGSTHAGINSDFDKLVKSEIVKNGKYGSSKVDFKTAVSEGLYKRFCFLNKEIWSQEKEDAWIKEIYDQYGIRATEELDAIPSDFSNPGSVVASSSFKKTYFQPNENTVYLRYFDLASSNNEQSYYSANVLIAVDTLTGHMVVWDYFADQLLPGEAHQRIIDTIRGNPSKGIPASPFNTFNIIEREPGSTVDFYIETLKKECPNHMVYEYRPTVNKLIRALPVANAVCKGELTIKDSEWADTFIGIISKFSGKKQPLITDLMDCLSGIYDFWHNDKLSILNKGNLFSSNNFDIYANNDSDDEVLSIFDNVGLNIDSNVSDIIDGLW